MNANSLILESTYKKIGLFSFNSDDLSHKNMESFRAYIKVLLVPKGYTLSVDFNQYETDQYTLFFINSNQYLEISSASNETASLIFYNRDFYCVQIHDAEVACDGLLFNNIFEIPKVVLSDAEAINTNSAFEAIHNELSQQDDSAEEMIRIYLKQLIISATRSWKKQNLDNSNRPIPREEQDFFRDFSRLVEIHFRAKHSVSEYAELLGIAPKTLSARFNRLKLENPNEIIKSRIVLEAKRLMLYTSLSIKEIAYQLGYEDPAYFNRTFNQKTGSTPASFKKTMKV